MNTHNISPNSDRDYIDNIDLSNEKNFPIFLKKIRFDHFKQIDNLEINFNHPISVISGINKTGKTTILMTIACSHLDFNKKNIKNGILERHTWSSFMRMTKYDQQIFDWTYYLTYKTGKRTEERQGKRNYQTKKWSGIGKKESQFFNDKKKRVIHEVRYIDLSRLLPTRNFGDAAFKIANENQQQNLSLSDIIIDKLNKYLSYIFEEIIQNQQHCDYLDKLIFTYSNSGNYSSFNAASGEEAIMRLLSEILEVDEKGLILIDEIDAGLHPKIQRRLLDVLYHISRYEGKQFIITSHSQTILSSVPIKSRIFIENKNGKFSCIQNSSLNAMLCKMDSELHTLFDIYCEDDIAKKIIEKMFMELMEQDVFTKPINVIICGSANKTYDSYKLYKDTYQQRKIKTGYACILDADMKGQKSSYSEQKFSDDANVHFLFGRMTDHNPEKFLVEQYLSKNPNTNLQYHLNNTNNHALFDKMIELNLSQNKDGAFNQCWDAMIQNNPNYLDDFKTFIGERIEYFTAENL
ncbi:AAA family ATPase [Haemophilus haemolyticus]|uniref:AAA family ATPase n=1 Tax=Haemophilus haemolyticus TaxID=726 RepID=UPI000E574301|nr:AAA family ATPase [Haemophilus haemolyticus]